MSIKSYQEGVLRDWWDDDTRVYTHYDSFGAVETTRAYTPDENAAADSRDPARQANWDSIVGKALLAMQNNRDFLLLDPPTNAQILAQVKALTRQNNGLIRLVLRRLEGTD